MTKEQILSEVANSNWQPEFEFTDDLDAVVDSILKPHEDYFLGLHSKVKEIIQREIGYFADYHKQCVSAGEPEQSYYRITFADVCNWQKELFTHKLNAIKGAFDMWVLSDLNQWVDKDVYFQKWNKANELPNQHINLGLRKTNVKVGEWTPPAPMFLEELKELCFPIIINKEIVLGDFYQGTFNSNKGFKIYITDWYKIFETIHFFEDLNGRLGGIIINILSYLLTDKYLIKK